MKKTKFVSGLLSAVLVLSAFAVPAAAADVTQTNSGGTATVSYTNDSMWTATIPTYVAPVEDGQQDVSAYEVAVKDVVIGENQQLAATIEYSGYVTEANGVKIPYQLYDSAGKEIQSGDTILSKSAGEPGTEATITFGAALTDSPKYAGVYTDTATFVFTAKDKAYSQEEIDADDHIFGIGYHESKDVIAIFNDDFTEVVIQENGDCQYNKGKMMGFTSPSSSYNTRQSPMTTHGDTLKKVIIKDGVTSVGNSAFENCSLLTSENISFPASVTSVGDYSFKSCLGLTDLSFLNQVAQIGVQAFSSCSNITDVVLSDNVVSVKSAAFTKCLSLKSAKLSPNMTEVASGLFNGCVALKDVSIPTGITRIGSGSFYKCSNLESIVLPDSVTTIEDGGSTSFGAFYQCLKLKNVSLGKSLTSIGSFAFYNCPALTDVSFPNSLQSIGASAFKNCTGLTILALPTSLTEIGNNSFQGCKALTSVIMPGVESIGSSAFYGCQQLKNVALPDSLANIGEQAFRGCSLTSINIPKKVSSIGPGAFIDTTISSFSVAIENNFYSSIDGVLFDKTQSTLVSYPCAKNAAQYEIPTGVTKLENFAIFGNNNLVSISIPNSVQSLGDNNFNLCGSLTHISIPNGVKSIGPNSFYACDSLVSVTIPESVTSIGTPYGSQVFVNCPAFTTIYGTAGSYAETWATDNGYTFIAQ